MEEVELLLMEVVVAGLPQLVEEMELLQLLVVVGRLQVVVVEELRVVMASGLLQLLAEVAGPPVVEGKQLLEPEY